MKGTKDLIKDILSEPDEKIRAKRMGNYLSENDLTPNSNLVINSVGGTVEILLSLVGLHGAVKVVKFIFKNQQSLFKVYNIIKCFFVSDGQAGIFLVDGVKQVFLDLNSHLYSIVDKGTVHLKVLRESLFG